jgi:2-polyprenyl-3-methyl-5-hydroxy-6-metoxy-1,4-benzoquinol methylase
MDEYKESLDPWGYESNPADKLRLQQIMRFLPNDYRGKRFLDIGCGEGFVSLAIKDVDLTGIDTSATAVVSFNSRAQLEKMSETHRAEQGSILEDLTPHGEFDFVLVTGVLYPHYVGKSQSFINQNISKSLKLGGYLISVHIAEMHPIPTFFTEIDSWAYRYREFTHELNVQRKL